VSSHSLISRLAAMAVIRRWRSAHGVNAHVYWDGGGPVGSIYFARAFDGTMKVGWSADPVRRVRSLIGYKLVVEVTGCFFREEASTHRFLASISRPVRGREWYPADSLVTSLAFWLSNAAQEPMLDAKPHPVRPCIGAEFGKGAE
jgi:hypothetical protein